MFAIIDLSLADIVEFVFFLIIAVAIFAILIALVRYIGFKISWMAPACGWIEIGIIILAFIFAILLLLNFAGYPLVRIRGPR